MKRISSILIAFLVIFSICPAYAANDITIYVNGNYLYCDVPAFLKDGRTMVPIRAISEAMGSSVDWDGKEQRVSIYNEEREVSLFINSTSVIVFDKGKGEQSRITIDVPPILVNARTFLPLRAVAESLGAEVDWDGSTKTVSVNSKKNNSKSVFDLILLGKGDGSNNVWSLKNPWTMEDLRGNVHQNSYICTIVDSVIMLNYYYKGGNYLEYLLDDDYTTFSGTIFVPKDATVSDIVGRLAVYGDGKLIREIEVERRDISVDFVIDITGCETLRLEWYRSEPRDQNSSTYLWISAPTTEFAITNFIVSKDPVTTSPAPDSSYSDNDEKLFRVPNFVGKDINGITNILLESIEAEFWPIMQEVYDNTVPKGIIISQTPAAGSMCEKNTDIILYVSSGLEPVGQTSGISYPPAPYFSYGGGEIIERNANGDIIKVTYYDTNGAFVGYSEFKRNTDYFKFTRIDYWYNMKGSLDYYVVNELDKEGNLIVAYFYTPDGTLFETRY